jgi:hypothetical protein
MKPSIADIGLVSLILHTDLILEPSVAPHIHVHAFVRDDFFSRLLFLQVIFPPFFPRHLATGDFYCPSSRINSSRVTPKWSATFFSTSTRGFTFAHLAITPLPIPQSRSSCQIEVLFFWQSARILSTTKISTPPIFYLILTRARKKTIIMMSA